MTHGRSNSVFGSTGKPGIAQHKHGRPPVVAGLFLSWNRTLLGRSDVTVFSVRSVYVAVGFADAAMFACQSATPSSLRETPRCARSYHTRQAFSLTIFWPGLQLKALAKS